MLYAFKITPALDETGKEIPIDTRHSEHSVRYALFIICGEDVGANLY